jgi:hypothetical protein
MYICTIRDASSYRQKRYSNRGAAMTIVRISTRKGTARVRTTLRPSVIHLIVKGI